jgi:uncharacterized protein (DUF486 family)
MRAVILLILSNVFMTFAWYGHLKFKDVPLWKAVIVSWLIAFVEYCFQVPANRYGSIDGYSTPQLKILQEVITIVVFCIFSVTVLNEAIKWNHLAGFGCVFAAVIFMRM